MAKTSKYGSKMKGARKVENKNTKYSSKMRGGRRSGQRSSKMSSKMTPTFNELVKMKTGGKV